MTFCFTNLSQVVMGDLYADRPDRRAGDQSAADFPGESGPELEVHL